MATSYAILRLYENVLQCHIATNDVSLKDIKTGVQSIAHVYAPNNSDFQSKVTKIVNFNDPACRCAYLHKCAPLHTYMVQDVMMQILKTIPDRFRKMLVSNSSRFKICSLGGGPGSDVIGVVTALLFTFGPFQPSVTIVDCMKKWEDTVALLMHELTVRPFATNYSNTWSFKNNCQWNYIECNLLNSMSNEVNKSIAAASMITMVKFVSAAICTETENMVDKIFRVMKPGALVLFIDNAAGGFTQIIERSGKRNGLVPIFGPMRHVDYESEAMKIDRFGYTSCFKTRVTIILMQKLLNHQNNRGNLDPLPKITSQKSNFGESSDLSNNKCKIDSIVIPRPSEAAKKSPAVAMPQKPASSLTAGQNRSSNNIKSISSIVRPSVVSSGTGRGKVENTTAHHPFTVTKKPPAAGTEQQLPSTITTANRKSILPNTPTPENRISNLNQIRTPQLDSGNGSKRNTSGVPVEQRRPVAVVPPESPAKYRSLTGDRNLRPKSIPSRTVRTYQPVTGDQNRRNQRLTEVNDNPEETCCSCCTIS